MANRPTPLFASETQAAQLLDLKPAEFRWLVKEGHLPTGKEIAPGYVRWDVDMLRMIGTRATIEGGGINW